MNGTKKIKYSRTDQIILGIAYVFLGVFVLSILIPLIYVVLASFMDPTVLNNQGLSFHIKDWTLDAYRRVLENDMIWRGFLNSFLYSIAFTVISVFVTLLAAYPMSKKEFVGRKFFNIIFLITMFFGGGMIPTFILINQLHMVNTIWAILIPGAFNVWNMILARTYYQSIPKELREASAIDGATEIQHFFKVMLPVCKPAATAAGPQIDPRSEYTSAGNDRRYPEYSRDGKSSRTAEICNYRCVKFTIAGNVSILPEILR